MVNRIHKIAFVTDDVESAVGFFTKTLGLEVSERFPNEDDDDYVFMKAGDIILELMPAKSTGHPVGFHHVSFAVEEIEAVTEELREKGVTITKEPLDAGAGGIHLAFFEGPNDLNLQLFERRTQGPGGAAL